MSLKFGNNIATNPSLKNITPSSKHINSYITEMFNNSAAWGVFSWKTFSIVHIRDLTTNQAVELRIYNIRNAFKLYN